MRMCVESRAVAGHSGGKTVEGWAGKTPTAGGGSSAGGTARRPGGLPSRADRASVTESGGSSSAAGPVITASLYLVDLAGSERASKVGRYAGRYVGRHYSLLYQTL
jgi:hypothetical protein